MTNRLQLSKFKAVHAVDSGRVYFGSIEGFGAQGDPLITLVKQETACKPRAIGIGFILPRGVLTGTHVSEPYAGYWAEQDELMALLPEMPANMELGRKVFVRRKDSSLVVEPVAYFNSLECLRSQQGVDLTTRLGCAGGNRVIRNFVHYTTGRNGSSFGVVPDESHFRRVVVAHGQRYLGQRTSVVLTHEKNGALHGYVPSTTHI